ncbi:hypothetical protein [Pseudacidovorax intermedius]|uniref:hypothetical protein n=1 Tax=Pseudacidovorax intermedius TaxID=433924 RepID=UPI0005C2875B|nr:hypothetical protein [Pseudacidovorax intermedius]
MSTPESYWAAALEADLSQGDLISDAWIGATVVPRTGLKHSTGKGGVKIWSESPFAAGPDGAGHFLARGRESFSLVLSQSCEIDKQGSKAPVLVAPVVDLAKTVPDPDLRQRYRSGGRYAFFPLPELPGYLPESYVDLRAITYMPRAVIDSLARHGSASASGLHSLTAHLVAFFTRVDMKQLGKPQPK